MKIISFHLNGKMAHFRKFYSNSSALSYFIPPRTTIVGIIAGLLGYERDSYYDEFTIDNCKIAVSSLKPIKKIIQKLNYLMIKSPNDFNGSKEHHSQTPVELIIPQNIRNDYVSYKIWVHHSNDEIMNKIQNVFQKAEYYKSLGISLALGSAFNLGWIENIEIMNGKEIEGLTEKNIYSAIPIDKVKEIKINAVGTNYKLIKEEFPIELNANRCITERGLKEVIVNLKGSPVLTVVNSYIQLDNGENIMWIE